MWVDGATSPAYASGRMWTDRSHQAIVLEVTARHPVERVFAAWSRPGDLEAWAWGSLGRDCRADVEFRVGGSFRISTVNKDGTVSAMIGRYTDIVTPERIAHTLRWEAEMGYEPVEELVDVRLTPQGGGTRIHFEHEGAFGAIARAEHSAGWNNVLERLLRHLDETP